MRTPEEMREYMREWRRKRVTPPVTNDMLQGNVTEKVVTLENVTEVEIQTLEPSWAWKQVIEIISRPKGLEKMQAVCGSLGKLSSEVWLGQTGLTAKDIGDVIGTGPAVVSIAPKGEPRDYCGHPMSELLAFKKP